MTDAISQYGRLSQSDPSLRSALDKLAKKSGETAADRPAESAPPARADTVMLSNVAEKAMTEPDFDRQKVESIKQAIAEGQYPLDAKRIAESFVAIERMIRD